MNLHSHLLTGSVFLNFILGVWLVLENFNNIPSKLFSLAISLLFYFFGVQLTDWDHPKVQKKLVVIWWLKYCTKHRGHWHSLVAVGLYGIISFLLAFFLFQLHYWYYPTVFGMVGYYSHLLADDLNTIKNRTGMPLVSIKVI